MGTATRAATDVRMVGVMVDDPESKLNRTVANVFRIWEAERAVKLDALPEPVGLTQLVFLDIGIPKGSSFDLYTDMGRKWMAMGVPENEIAYANDYESDAERLALYKAMNEGKIRILIGSTARVGTGVNIQRLLSTIHHIDIPWTPAAVEQREGRGWRPGNLNPFLTIYRYVVAKSLDFHKWQLLEFKERSNRQLFIDEEGVRTVQDLDMAVLNFAQMKALATGNPLVMEKVKVETELTKLNALRQKWVWDRREASYELAGSGSTLKRYRTQAETARAAAEYRAKFTEKPDVIVKGKRYKKRSEAGDHLLDLVTFKLIERDVVDLGYAKVSISDDFSGRTIALRINVLDHDMVVETSESGVGMLTRIDNAINGLESDALFFEGQAAALEAKRVNLADTAARGFEYQDRLDEAERRYDEIASEMEALARTESNATTAAALSEESEQ